MTNELDRYLAVSHCRHLLRRGCTAAVAAREACAAQALDATDEASIRAHALAAENAFAEWREQADATESLTERN